MKWRLVWLSWHSGCLAQERINGWNLQLRRPIEFTLCGVVRIWLEARSQNPHTVPSGAILRYSVVLCVEYCVVHFVCAWAGPKWSSSRAAALVWSISDMLEGMKDSLEILAILKCGQAFYILKDKYAWFLSADIVVDVMENSSSAFAVMETLLKASFAKRLAGKACDVKINSRSGGVVTQCDVVVDVLWMMVAHENMASFLVIFARKHMGVRNLKVIKCEDGCVKSGAVRTYSDGVGLFWWSGRGDEKVDVFMPLLLIEVERLMVVNRFLLSLCVVVGCHVKIVVGIVEVISCWGLVFGSR